MKYSFIGLILGSIPLLIKNINSKHTFRIHYIMYTLFTFTLGILLTNLENIIPSNTNIIFDTFTLYSNDYISILLLIISGFLMSIGIVVPGISSTLILMLLGIYDIYLNSIATINLAILIPLGIGILIRKFYIFENY